MFLLSNFKGSTGSNDKSVAIWDLSGTLNFESNLGKQSIENSESLQESQVVNFAENNDNDLVLLEKLDDIADGAINSCSFYGTDVLATGSG